MALVLDIDQQKILMPKQLDSVKKTTTITVNGRKVEAKLGLVRAAHALKEINQGREKKTSLFKILLEIIEESYDMPLDIAITLIYWASEKPYFQRYQEKLTRDMVAKEFDRLDNKADDGDEQAYEDFLELCISAFYLLITTSPPMMRQLDPIINPKDDEAEDEAPLASGSNSKESSKSKK